MAKNDPMKVRGLDNARSKKRRVSNRSRKTAVSKDGAPPAEFEDFYAPHITDPDPPQEMKSEAETKRAARNVFEARARRAAQIAQVLWIADACGTRQIE